jgi:hypothetical protein
VVSAPAAKNDDHADERRAITDQPDEEGRQ